MANSLLKEASQALENWWSNPLRIGFFPEVLSINISGYKRITDLQDQLQILAHWERPGWKPAMYKAARKLREVWGLPLEPDTQTAITEFFISLNTTHWERVGRWQEQVLDFLRSGSKAALGEVAENLHKQWDQGIPVVQQLIGGRTDVGTTLAWYGLGVVGIKEIVGVTEDQPVDQQIARLLDPFFEQENAFEIGNDLCREHGIPIEEGVFWGTNWGFIKRNTIDFAKEKDPTRRGEIIKWLHDDARVDGALRRLTGNLELYYSVVAVKKLC
jgi:hypothetical protein